MCERDEGEGDVVKPKTLQQCIENASCHIHGSCTLHFDGDHFGDAPWSCIIRRWPFIEYASTGKTPEEAIEKAIFNMNFDTDHDSKWSKNNYELLRLKRLFSWHLTAKEAICHSSPRNQ